MQANVSNSSNVSSLSTQQETSTSDHGDTAYWIVIYLEHMNQRSWAYYNDPTVSDFSIFVLILVVCTALFLFSMFWHPSPHTNIRMR